jgi:hypothetical protein
MIPRFNTAGNVSLTVQKAKVFTHLAYSVLSVERSQTST